MLPKIPTKSPTDNPPKGPYPPEIQKALEEAFLRMETSVYFVSCGSFMKIGFASNPSGRLAEMQVGNPYELTLEAVIVTTRAEAEKLERELHRLLDERSIGGEWFHLSLDEVKDRRPDLICRIVTGRPDAGKPRRRRVTPPMVPPPSTPVPRGAGIDVSNTAASLLDMAERLADFQRLSPPLSPLLGGG